jgi:SAM-dependent methyltransferase
VGLLDRLAPRRPDHDRADPLHPLAEELVFPTKALRKFLAAMSAKVSPTVMDLAPVVGSNLNFLGDRLGCKVVIEDIYAEVERHAREQKMSELPAFLASRFQRADAAVDGVLCWDVLDYLDRPAAHALAEQLTRLLKPEGVLLAFFGTAPPRDVHYTRYIIVDELNLKHRPYPASRGRQAVLANRDIIQLFGGLRVSDSFLLQNSQREILFRKPAYETR